MVVISLKIKKSENYPQQTVDNPNTVLHHVAILSGASLFAKSTVLGFLLFQRVNAMGNQNN